LKARLRIREQNASCAIIRIQCNTDVPVDVFIDAVVVPAVIVFVLLLTS